MAENGLRDCRILDGDSVFPVADRLVERGIPFVFATGYDASAIPPRFDRIIRCEKPVDMRMVMGAMGRIVEA